MIHYIANKKKEWQLNLWIWRNFQTPLSNEKNKVQKNCVYFNIIIIHIHPCVFCDYISMKKIEECVVSTGCLWGRWDIRVMWWQRGEKKGEKFSKKYKGKHNIIKWIHRVCMCVQVQAYADISTIKKQRAVWKNCQKVMGSLSHSSNRG